MHKSFVAGLIAVLTAVALSVQAAINQIAAGDEFSLALLADGTVCSWGYAYYGELGNGTADNRNTPGLVSGVANITAIDAGEKHALALRSDGYVGGWGYNINYQLGETSQEKWLTPIMIGGISDVTRIAAGGYHSLALKANGTVWAWGYNYYGQLGDGTLTTRATPAKVLGLSGVTAISGGWGHCLALRNDGTVWAWGYNGNGMLGDGSTTDRSTPVQVVELTGVTAISAGGYHSLALKADGTVWAWGANEDGQLGNGTGGAWSYSPTPLQVVNVSNIVAIEGGTHHSLAIQSDGTLWVWGDNRFAQLGDGTFVDRWSPFTNGLNNVNKVVGGNFHSLALKQDGTVWAWGWGDSGELGYGGNLGEAIPTLADRWQIPEITINGSAGPVSLSAGNTLSIAVSLLNANDSTRNGDWWLAVETPLGFFFYVLPGYWTVQPQSVYQGAFFSFGATDVLSLNTAGLPAGNYIFYFGVDPLMDGAVDIATLTYDSVVVTLTP
ncbi:MAG: hypothetical protein HYV35_06015 [Lentisphaerae bacterium]|nr:hypothetical protein [Lentisphaerota bacterium]